MKKQIMLLGALALALALITMGCADTADTEQHTHQFGETVWGNTVWLGTFATDVPATTSVAGRGHENGIKYGTQTCAEDGTTKNVQEPTTRDVVIPIGKQLNANGTFSDIGHDHQYAWVDTSERQWVVKPTDSSKEIEQKKQEEVCQLDGTKSGAIQWVATGAERDKQQGHDHQYAWVDTAERQWVAKPTDSSKEIEQKKQEEVCQLDGTKSGAIQWVATGAERDKQQQQTPPTLPSIAGKNIDTLGRIGVYSTSGSSIGGLTNDKVYGIMQTTTGSPQGASLCVQLYDQAAALNVFFANTTGLSGNLETKFAALRLAEKEIGNTANAMPSLTSYLGTVDTQRDAIITEIFGTKGTEKRDTFDANFDAYAKGQYIATTDWNTRGLGAQTTAVGEFDVLLSALTSAVKGSYSRSGSYENGRVVLQLGSESAFNSLNGRLTDAMKTQIVSALGLTGVTNANEMANALIIQLGQDHEEFRALVDDIEAENLTQAFEYTGYTAGKATLSSLGSQSTTRLAALDTTFNPSTVKGAYGSSRVC